MIESNKTNTIVTGGTGLIGTYLKNLLPANYLSSKDFDLTNETDVRKMYEVYKPDIVIHLAAKVGGILDNIRNPFDYFEHNVLINTLVMKYSRIYNVKKFVGILSSCAYPDVSNNYPLSESNLHEGMPNINNLGYGYSKRLLGLQIDMFRNTGLNYSYLIPNNLYGEFERGDIDQKHFIGALLKKIKTANELGEKSIVLFGDGTPLRQFTFAEDIARIILLIIKNNIKENLNVGISENLSIDEIAKLSLVATNSSHLKIEYDSTKPNGQYRKDISIKKFNDLFPEFKFTSYLDGMRKTYLSL